MNKLFYSLYFLTFFIICTSNCLTTTDYSTLSATCNSTYPGKCLIYEQEKEFNYEDAKAYCSKFNFTILKIESMKENNLISRIVSPTAGAWITANALSDGSRRALRFHPRCKNRCCGIYISSDGFWREDFCDRTHGIICQRKGIEEFPLLADLLEQMEYEQRLLQKEKTNKQQTQQQDLNTSASSENAAERRQGKSFEGDSNESGRNYQLPGSRQPSGDYETGGESVSTDESIVRVHTVIGSVTKASDTPAVILRTDDEVENNNKEEKRKNTESEDEKEEELDKDKDTDYDYESKSPPFYTKDVTPTMTPDSTVSYDSDDSIIQDDSSQSSTASVSSATNNNDNNAIVRASISSSIKLMMLLLAAIAIITLILLMMHLVLVKSRSASYEVPPEAGLIQRDYMKW